MELKNLFFEEHPNPMLIYDQDSLEILRVNKRFVDLYGYGKSEIRGMMIEDIRPSEDIPILHQKLDSLREHSKAYDVGTVRHMTKSGEILHVQITSQNVPIAGENSRIVHIHNLTKTVNLKNRYKNTLDELNHHINQNPLAMIKFDHDFRIIDWSKRSEEKLGFTKEEVLGKTLFEVGLIPENEQELIREKIQQLTDGQIEKSRFEALAVTAEGKQIYIKVHASTLRTKENNLKSVVAFIENINAQKRTELLFKTTEEMAGVGGWEYNPNTAHLYWTDETYRIYELPGDEEVQLTKALDYYISEDKKRLTNDLDKAIHEQKGYDSEYRMVTANGNNKWVRALGRPILRNGNVFKIVGSLQDITEQKLKEQEIQEGAQEKEVLLAEIHHRVKNNLAIISGLLELKALNMEDEQMKDILRQSQMRIQSMSMIHEALYKAEDFSNLEFHSFVENLLSAIEDAHGYLQKDIRLELHCTDSLKLNVNQAIPCGLIINELVTNSFKHAFEEQDEGLIKVSIIFEQEKDEIILQVRDNGQGLPDDFIERQNNSLGSKLIQQLTKQLGGSLNLQNRNGALVELTYERSDKSGSSSQHFTFS